MRDGGTAVLDSREHVTWVTHCRSPDCSGMIVRHVVRESPYRPITLCALCTSRYFNFEIEKFLPMEFSFEFGRTDH